MTQKRTTITSTSALNLGDSRLEALIMLNLYDPISRGYLIRCYCRKCHRNYDTTKNGINLLERKNPDDPIILPKGISDLRDEEQAKQCFLVLEPCFMCREKDEKIITTAHLIPDKSSLLDQYSKNPLNGRSNKNLNGRASHVQQHDISSQISPKRAK